MNSISSKTIRERDYRCLLRVAVVLALVFAFAGTAAAQKKKKKDDTPAETPASAIASLPDEQRIDYTIGQWLGAWQVGNTDELHKNMADDVSVVNGLWAPPVMGWTNYLAAYQMQRARTQQVRLERSNTLIRIAPSATVAWVCYQWDFSAMVDGAPSTAQGQTTLVLEKRGENWIIVHNHTSLVPTPPPAAPANAPPAPKP